MAQVLYLVGSIDRFYADLISMKYLKHFNKQLKKIRESRRLSTTDIGEFCLVDPSVVKAWEATGGGARCYPTLDNLLDLCLKTGVPLENFIDLPQQGHIEQLELPGLAFTEDSDLDASLHQLDQELDRLIPADDEQELLRRYRKSDAQSKELILQLIAN